MYIALSLMFLLKYVLIPYYFIRFHQPGVTGYIPN